MAVPHQAGRFRSGDVTLHYRRLGKPGRTPIVLVHGLSYFSWDWLEIAAALGAERECVALDQRGFGDSTWSPHKDYSVPAMAQDLANLLAHLGWPRAVLCGHSMGGRASAYLAAKQPRRVAALVLVDYSPDNAPAGSKRVAHSVAGTPEAFATIEDAMRHFGAPASGRERFEAWLRPVPGGFAVKRDTHFRDQFRKALQTGERPKLGVDMWQVLGEVSCPTLVVRGTRSDLFAPEAAARMRSVKSYFTLAEVEAPHDIPGENPQGLLAVLAPFLAAVEEKRHGQEKRDEQAA
jgi:pimeloyl-ACP methyl ester carboxylesterase